MNNELTHHGIKGMRWGVRNGPPYPLKVHQNFLNRSFGRLTGHYARRNLNVNLPKSEKEAKKQGWRKLSQKMSSMHQHHTEGGVPNTKWISPDGHREVVFTGKGRKQHITHNPADEGSYNHFDQVKNPLAHAIGDVLPYLISGNSEYDATTKADRVLSTVQSFVGSPSSSINKKSVSRGKKTTSRILKRKRKKR